MPVPAGKDDGFVKIAALTGRENSADRLDDGKDAKPALAAKAKMPDLEALKRAAGLEISNGTGRLRMAGRMSRHLLSLGVVAARLTNAESYSNKVSILHFRPGQISKAMMLSNILPVSPTLHRNADIRTELRLVLGGDLLKFDRQLIAKFK